MRTDRGERADILVETQNAQCRDTEVEKEETGEAGPVRE